MDEIDKALWKELYGNCRLSYQYLADKLEVSATAIRKRIDRLIERGVIVEWTISLAPAMIDCQFAFVEVNTEESHDSEYLFKEFYDRPEIFVILPLTTGDYALHVVYSGAEGLFELGSFIRQLDGVKETKIHPTLVDNGTKIELGGLQKRVLKSLIKDPRMSIAEVANESGLTARRVRKIIDQLIKSNAFIFDFTWNPNAGERLAFLARIEYDSRIATSESIEMKLRTDYNLEFFYSHVSAIEPVMFSLFMVNHLFDMEKIVKDLRMISGVKTLRPLIYYSATVVAPPTTTRLQELLSEN